MTDVAHARVDDAAFVAEMMHERDASYWPTC